VRLYWLLFTHKTLEDVTVGKPMMPGNSHHTEAYSEWCSEGHQVGGLVSYISSRFRAMKPILLNTI
jgi:hypothetical protein